ncbi:hypothetical protein DFH08DRAFT_967803 [Mycena albidolilacea]|uniref:Transmembrane protein n=1 Tax=Mycena albidolilacea TaxID=1033008 RepID=A0AAD7EIB4_9AGAR|nr:hypothetical protein DFH08DRAFT_967803 [Mycena albidolilacea]
MNSGPSGAQTMSSAFSRVLSPLTICYRYFQNYCHLFGVSCLVYDHAVTLGALTLIVLLQRILIIYFLEDRECSFVWTHTKTASAYWFFILRYGALMTNIPVIVFSFVTLPWPKVSLLDSDSFGLLIEGLLVMWSLHTRAQVPWYRDFTHANAFSRHDPADICTVWTQCACAVVFDRNSNMFHSTYAVPQWSTMTGQKGIPIIVFAGCHLSIVRSASYHLATSWVCLFAFDSIIFGLTIYNAYSTRRGVGSDARMPIHKLMVRDGAMYFAAMALANLANIITFLIGGVLLQRSQFGLPVSFCSTSVTMMSRLMLNLHERTEYGVLTALIFSGVEDEIEDLVEFRGAEAYSLNDIPVLPLSRVGPDMDEVEQV